MEEYSRTYRIAVKDKDKLDRALSARGFDVNEWQFQSHSEDGKFKGEIVGTFDYGKDFYKPEGCLLVNVRIRTSEGKNLADFLAGLKVE